MSKPALAVVGAGTIGRAHIDTIRKTDGCALVAIVDPDATARALAGQYQVLHFNSLEALLESGSADAVILATPNALHLEQAEQCVAAMLPTLLEKPVTTTVAEGEQLARTVAAGSARVLVGHHRAHSAIMATAKRLVDSGALGSIVAVNGTALFCKPDSYFAEAPWRTQTGAGPILINLIHEIHNLRMLCGPVTGVQAFVSASTRQLAVEDTAAITLRFASGALGTFLLSDTAASACSWEQTAGENPAYAHYADEDCYLITGTKGSLAVPTLRLTHYAEATPRSWMSPFVREQIAFERDDPLLKQLQHFLQVIRGDALPLVDVNDGLANLRVVEAIREAARSGCTVTVDHVGS